MYSDDFESNRVVPFASKTPFPVEVRPSEGKGRGVFATETVRRGRVMCWYDGVFVSDGIAGALISGKQGYFQLKDHPCGVAGFPDIVHDGGCAQLVNDYETDYDPNDLKYWKHINVTVQFMQLADNKVSVIFKSTKEIKKGCELFYSYGMDYWRTRKIREATMDIEDNYAFHVFNDVLNYARLDSEKKAWACNTYREALDLPGYAGFKKRYDIVNHRLKHLIELYNNLPC